jgi:serine/threonine protein kinase, bacterial
MTILRPKTGMRRRPAALLAGVCLSLAMASCGGGGSEPAFDVGGVVSGLASGQSVTVADGGSRQQVTVSANGSYSAAVNLPSGTAYSLSITSQPLGQLCSITNASGTVGSAGVSNVAIACANSLTVLTRNTLALGFGLTTDSTGNVYVADASDDVVYKITPAGDVSTLAGQRNRTGSTDGAGADARFDSPSAIASDAAGNLLVADTLNGTVRRVSLQGVVTTLAGRAGELASTDGALAVARFTSPQGIAVDGAGNVYVAEEGNDIVEQANFPHRIRKIGVDGLVTTLAGSPTGRSGSTDGVGTNALFRTPRGLVTDSAGNVYVADSGNHTIRKISPQGAVSTLAGSAGEAGSADGAGASARFNQPWALAIDGSGNLYVTDRGNHTVRKVSPQGVVSTVIGRAGVPDLVLGALPAGLSFPAGIALHGGRLYVNTGPNAVVWVYAP